MQSELQQPPRMARRAPAEMYKCSEPYETHGLSERLPRLPPSLPLPPPLPPRGLLPPPPPRLGAAGERNLPPPSLSLSPSPSPHPTLSPPVLSPPPSPPTHPLAGSRLSPAPPPAAARPPARSTPCGQAPARRSQGETETEGKKLQLGLRGSGLGRGSWRAGGATPKGALLSTFWASRCPVFCCNPDRERK